MVATVKIRWWKKAVGEQKLAELVKKGMPLEDQFAREGRYTNPFTYRWLYWLVEQVEEDFLAYARACTIPEVQAIVKYADRCGRPLLVKQTHGLYGGPVGIEYARYVLDTLAVGVQTNAITERYVRSQFNGHVYYVPFSHRWEVPCAGSGVTDEEIGQRFMADPNLTSFEKQNWGRDLLQAVEDYCFDRTEGKLLLTKKGEIVKGESGGRVIFRSPQAALNFLYPHGYDPNESEYIGHVVYSMRQELIALVQSLPGAKNWGNKNA